MKIETFILDNLQYILGLGGSVIAFKIISADKTKKTSNNLRRFIIKYKKQQDGISKQVKGMTR